MLLALQYPNGRVHECTRTAPLTPGSEFSLYGRTWRPAFELPPDRTHTQPRLLCLPTTQQSPLTDSATTAAAAAAN